MSVLYLHTSSPINCLMGENHWVLTEDYVHLYLTNLIITSVQPGNGLLFSLHELRRILTYLQSGVRQLRVWVQCRSPVIQTKLGKRHCLVSLTSFSVTEIWSGRELVFEFSPSADTDSQHPQSRISSPFETTDKGRHTRLNCSRELCSMFLKQPLDLVEKHHSSNLERT